MLILEAFTARRLALVRYFASARDHELRRHDNYICCVV